METLPSPCIYPVNVSDAVIHTMNIYDNTYLWWDICNATYVLLWATGVLLQYTIGVSMQRLGNPCVA